MIREIEIRDLVVIERAHIEPVAGLTAITGETGAGKSILLDSLGLALGARAEAGVVRTGAERASVTAIVDLATDHAARRIASAQGLDVEGDLILRRAIGSDGRSRAFVNDQLDAEVLAQFQDLGVRLLALRSGLLP